MSELPECDREVFRNGECVAVLCNSATSRDADIEEWVVAVRAASGQRVDWHYSGGRASVLFLGDHARVLAAVRALLPSLRATVLALYETSGEHGPYRAGDPVPEGVIGGCDEGLIVTRR